MRLVASGLLRLVRFKSKDFGGVSEAPVGSARREASATRLRRAIFNRLVTRLQQTLVPAPDRWSRARICPSSPRPTARRLPTTSTISNHWPDPSATAATSAGRANTSPVGTKLAAPPRVHTRAAHTNGSFVCARPVGRPSGGHDAEAPQPPPSSSSARLSRIQLITMRRKRRTGGMQIGLSIPVGQRGSARAFCANFLTLSAARRRRRRRAN